MDGIVVFLDLKVFNYEVYLLERNHSKNESVIFILNIDLIHTLRVILWIGHCHVWIYLKLRFNLLYVCSTYCICWFNDDCLLWIFDLSDDFKLAQYICKILVFIFTTKLKWKFKKPESIFLMLIRTFIRYKKIVLSFQS